PELMQATDKLIADIQKDKTWEDFEKNYTDFVTNVVAKRDPEKAEQLLEQSKKAFAELKSYQRNHNYALAALIASFTIDATMGMPLSLIAVDRRLKANKLRKVQEAQRKAGLEKPPA